MKKNLFKKNTSVGFNWCFDPKLVIFLEMKIFSFPKNMGSKHQSNPTLVFFSKWIFFHFQRMFFCIFEKNDNDWIKSFSKSKWTGLKFMGFLWSNRPTFVVWISDCPIRLCWKRISILFGLKYLPIYIGRLIEFSNFSCIFLNPNIFFQFEL